MASAAPVFISSRAAEEVFSWREAVAAISEAYSKAPTRAALPPRTVGSDDGAWLRTLPALPPGRRYFGAKLMGMAGAGADPGAEYVIVLYDRETSSIAAFVDGNRVTAYRTAATSAAALDRLVPRGPLRLAILGSGLEAMMHVRALAVVRPLERITVFSPTPERREAFAAAIRDELPVEAETADDPERAVAAATVVLAAARSYGEKPILFGDWLAPAATVASIGSTVPSQRELDTSVVAACDLIVCDDVDEVSEQTGDMLAATSAGIDFRDRTFSLHQLVTGELDERVAASRRPLYKSIGGGLQDVVVAELLLREALAAGLATPLPIEFEKKR
jgi:ornithine cyclodeaminase/alanine dehydrogenase